MSLLHSLFPGIEGFQNKDRIPFWHELDMPWTILNPGEGGIENQILKKTGGDHIYIHTSASIGNYVTIEGPCYVGPNVEIRHGAYLRGRCWISDGCVVGGSTEIKNSILLPGSKAPHFNYVGDSILGFGVNLGAGTKLSNVRNDRGTIPLMNAKRRIFDSGLTKLGALIGDNAHLGCNVVTNPGTIIYPDSMVRPNEAVSGLID